MSHSEFDLFTSLRYDRKLLLIPEASIEHLKGAWNVSKPSPLYMLDYHRDRMLRAATYFGWTDAIAVIDGDAGLVRLEAFILGLPEVDNHPLRVKVMLSKAGKLGHQAGQVPETTLPKLFPLSLPNPGDDAHDGGVTKSPVYRVLVDLDRTRPSEYTHYKTTRREMYDGARQRMGIGPTDLAEALLVNAGDDSVMEGSLTTPYFWRNGRWVTPPVPPRFSQNVGSGGQDGTTRRWALERGLCVEGPVKASSLVEGEECWISNGVRGFNFGRITLTKSG